MELRFVERLEEEHVGTFGDGTKTYRLKPVRILQFRDWPSSPWRDVPLEKETGTEPTTGKAE